MMAQTDHQALALERYVERVGKALDAAYARALAAGEMRVLNLTTDRYIIFADQHRGARNGADDFLRAERAYNAALAYYFHRGYTLVILGDAEELWEETPAAVLRAYPRTFELEARFHRHGRYVRIWGNHDDIWQYEANVRRQLAAVYGAPPLRVYESLCFTVMEGTLELGKLFLLHGHQGDTLNAQWTSKIARFFIRYFWRTFQKLTHISPNTPATKWGLRESCNRALYTWAARQPKLVFIAGHTHAPVFSSQTQEAQIAAKIKALANAGMVDEVDEETLSLLLAQYEWVLAQDHPHPPAAGDAVPLFKPCYFNAGCCCFADGNITGIEIAQGQIRLVRWPDKQNKPKPHVLIETALRDVLAAC